jgi:hypothetical protein
MHEGALTLLLAQLFFGRDGFWGTRASLMMDIVFTAMMIVVPVMAWSIWSVRRSQKYSQHKWVQLILAITLLVAVVLFELEMRLVGWRDRAIDSPFWTDGGWNDAVDYSLAIHLLFAIPTPLLWGVVIGRALKGFPSPPRPNAHSGAHRFWAWLGAVGMVLTSVTGWAFYYFAFAAAKAAS